MTIPDDVRTFLHDHIDSYEQLEILLLLRLEGADGCTADQIGSRLNIAPALAANALASLRASQIAEAHVHQSETRYRYTPANVSLAETLNRLANAYATHPIDVIKLMSANAISRIRTGALRVFSDAFLLYKGRDDG